MDDFADLCAVLGLEPPPDRTVILVTAVVLLADAELDPVSAYVFTAHPNWFPLTETACIEAAISCLHGELDRLAED